MDVEVSNRIADVWYETLIVKKVIRRVMIVSKSMAYISKEKGMEKRRRKGGEGQ